VRDFDPVDIPEECFGGEETGLTGMFQNSQKTTMRSRNSYICVYKRKLQDDVQHSDEEVDGKEELPTLGKQCSNIEASENPLLPGIAFDNHKFW